MNDQLDPFCDNGQDEISPEFNAVRSSDDGFNCGNGEDDALIAFCNSLGL